MKYLFAIALAYLITKLIFNMFWTKKFLDRTDD